MGRAQFLDMFRSRLAQFLDAPRPNVLATCSGRVAVFRHAQARVDSVFRIRSLPRPGGHLQFSDGASAIW